MNSDIDTEIEMIFDQLQGKGAVMIEPPTCAQYSASSADLPDDVPRLTAEGAPDTDAKEPSSAADPDGVDQLQGNDGVMTVQPTYVQLSALLAGLPGYAKSLVVENTLDAVGRGMFKAASLADTFKIDYKDAGKRIRKTKPDLAILHSPEFEAWMEVQRRDARHRSMVRSGKAQTTMQHIVSGEDHFDALADLTRRTLAQRTKKKK